MKEPRLLTSEEIASKERTCQQCHCGICDEMADIIFTLRAREQELLEEKARNGRLSKLNKHLVIKRDEFGWLKKEYGKQKSALAEAKKENQRLTNRLELVSLRAAFPPEVEEAANICARPFTKLAHGKDWPFTEEQLSFVNDLMRIRADEIRKSVLKLSK